MDMKRFFVRGMGALAFLLGVTALVYGCYSMNRDWECSKVCVETDGIVIHPYRPLTIKFQTEDGNQITHEQSRALINTRSLKVGQLIKMAYRPDAPSQSWVASEVILTPAIVIVFSFVGIIVGGIFLRTDMKNIAVY